MCTIAKMGEESYLELIKAMHDCLKSARLFWEHVSMFLAKMGFDLNRYDSCVVNKIVDGTICIVAWHVDDLKISHKSKTVVHDVINKLEEAYVKITINTGDEHTYCGMNLIYEQDGSVIIDMIDYLHETIAEFREDCSRAVNSPAAVHLFETNEQQKKLDLERKTLFHRIVAKLLFVASTGNLISRWQ